MRDLPEKQEFGKKTGCLMMKSLYGLIMVVLLSFSLCGCGLVDKIKDKIFPGAETEAEEPDPGQYRQNPEAEPVIVINASDIKVDFAADVTPTTTPTT